MHVTVDLNGHRSELPPAIGPFNMYSKKEPRALSKLFGLPILQENQNAATG